MQPRRLVGLLVAVLVAATVSACGGGAGEVVARVGGSPIYKSTLDHWIAVATGRTTTATVDPSSASPAPPRDEVLSFLISAQSTLGEANALGVGASDGEAQRQLEQLAFDEREGIAYEGLPGTGELPTLLAKATDSADRVWLMKLALIGARVEQKHVAQAEGRIAPAEIASYYQEHKAQFVLPEKRDLEWIVTYSAPILRQAVREIRAGKDFMSVAERVSLDPPTITGLELATAREKDFARHVFAARPHVIEGPFLQVQNHYVLEVTHVTPARQQSAAESEAAIRRRLGALRASEAAPAFVHKWISRTSCSVGYVVSICGR